MQGFLNEEDSRQIGKFLSTGVFKICPIGSWRRTNAVNRSEIYVLAQVKYEDLCNASWRLRSNVLSDSYLGSVARACFHFR
jgi:hypothetical protein